MDFTREPIIETVITPREGYRLVVRSSKNIGQEEYFVEALEVVSFGNAFFFRCLERPKPFIVPLADYEVFEMREPRMVLKTPALDTSVKITQERHVSPPIREQEAGIAPHEMKADRRKDRRRSMRRRRGGVREDIAQAAVSEEQSIEDHLPIAEPELAIPQHEATEDNLPEGQEIAHSFQASMVLTSVLPPPTTLIRDDLARLRSNDAYKGAFYVRDDDQKDDDEPMVEGFGGPVEEIAPVFEPERTGGDLEVSPEEPFCVTNANSCGSDAQETLSKAQEDMEPPL